MKWVGIRCWIWVLFLWARTAQAHIEADLNHIYVISSFRYFSMFVYGVNEKPLISIIHYPNASSYYAVGSYLRSDSLITSSVSCFDDYSSSTTTFLRKQDVGPAMKGLERLVVLLQHIPSSGLLTETCVQVIPEQMTEFRLVSACFRLWTYLDWHWFLTAGHGYLRGEARAAMKSFWRHWRCRSLPKITWFLLTSRWRSAPIADAKAISLWLRYFHWVVSWFDNR